MPKLSQCNVSDSPQSVIAYGPPKSGKTYLVGQLAKEYNLYWIDIENGHSTLFQFPQEYQERIELINVVDNKDNPNAINTVAKLLTGTKQKVCTLHGKIACGPCTAQKEEVTEYCFNDLDTKKDIVVIDSLTQLTSSAQAHVCRDLDLEKSKMTYDHWGVQRVLLEKVLDLIQNARFNVVVISHEMGVEQVDKSEKIMPAGGTKNFARTVAKYFGHIIHMSVKNRKHIANSVTTATNNVLTGSRTNAVVDAGDIETFLALFKEAGKVTASTTQQVKRASPSAGGASSLLSRMKKS